MKKSQRQKRMNPWILSILMSSWAWMLDASPATAGLAQLLGRMDSPVGRLVMRSPQIQQLTDFLLLRAGETELATALRTSRFEELLLSESHSQLAEVLEQRLARIEERLRLSLRQDPSHDAAILLRELCEHELAFVIRDGSLGLPQPQIPVEVALREAQYTGAARALERAGQATDRTHLVTADLAGRPLGPGADLSHHDLRFSRMGHAHATHAQMEGARLDFSDLRDVDFRFSDLHGAQLVGANLTGAKLQGVNFDGADLRLAILSRTNLVGANFSGADLRGADLSNAFLAAYFQGGGRIDVIFRGAIIDATTVLPEGITPRRAVEVLGMRMIRSP
jgi:uncharacterized protein YjbI with pentapeptide repeats